MTPLTLATCPKCGRHQADAGIDVRHSAKAESATDFTSRAEASRVHAHHSGSASSRASDGRELADVLWRSDRAFFNSTASTSANSTTTMLVSSRR